MDKNKKIMLIVGVAAAVGAYFMFANKPEEKIGDPDTDGDDDLGDIPDVNTNPLDNPAVGPYQGDKPRSQGNSTTITPTVQPYGDFSMCVPAMESEGGGKGKYISVDDPYTPKAVESQRRQLITDNLSVGDTIDLDGRACTIKKFWKDSAGRNAAIQCENHDNISYDNNSQICWT